MFEILPSMVYIKQVGDSSLFTNLPRGYEVLKVSRNTDEQWVVKILSMNICMDQHGFFFRLEELLL